MNDKQSYPGSLNAGRERRSGAILDDITEKLDALERRISAERTARPVQPAPYRQRDIAPGPAPRRPVRSNVYNDIAHDLERARERSDEFGSISRISHDLQALREELRQEMSHGIRQEFDSLRRQMADFYQDVQAGLSSRELAPELERIAAGVAALSERSGNRDVMALRQDVEDLRETMDALAREETLRSVNNRWDDFDRRWDRIADHIEGGVEASGRADAMFDRLSERMEAIYEALEQVPSRSVLASLEDKVRTLTEAVGQIADAQARISPDLFHMVEDRLDEISRAIVASSVAAEPIQLDTAPLERIEARISALANQINEVASQDNGALLDQLHTLTQRVDGLSRDRDLPSEDLERIAAQLGSITRILSDSPAPPDMAVILDGVEQRINALGAVLENRTHDASRQSMTLFKDLEGRISDLAGKIEAMPRAGDSGHAHEIEARFQDLTARLEESTQRQSRSEAALLSTLDERLRGFQKELETRQAAAPADTRAIENIEARLEAISAQLDEASRAILPEVDASLVASLGTRLDEIASRLDETSRNAEAADRSLIEHLEAQVADMARFMSNPGSTLPELENLSPRLEEIERALATNHETILQTAQRAAEDALRSASADNAAHHDAVAALAEDLKSLDKLARRSEERNTKTFEAIHETLLKIVDRLATLEASGPAGKPDEQAVQASQAKPEPAAKAAKRAIEQAPSIDVAGDFEDAEPVPAMAVAGSVAAPVSPSQAAAAAAFAALQEDGETAVTEAEKRPSMFDGLTRALRGKKPAVPQEPSMEGAPVLDDGHDDTPLEPGDSTPDLTAIMEKVRADREAERSSDPDAAKADFIAAARRAAQAAAAEAEMLKGKATLGSSGSKFSVGALLQEKRKPILMAAGAIMILLAGLQVGKMVLSGNEDIAVTAEQGALSEPDTETTAEIPARQITPDSGAAFTADAENPGDDIIPAEPVTTADDALMAEPEADAADMMSAGDMSSDGGVETELADDGMGETADEGAAQPTPAIAFGPVPLREAVAAGDPKAFFEVGNRYSEGRGVAASPEEAAKWYARSAEAGFAPGQYRYGNLLEKGIGVERDLEGAKAWYQMAAQQGNASAMHNLAVLFATGADGVTDNASAVRWFMEAAELGIKDSQFNLGILAAKGVGMSQDLEESYKWFAVAARNGDKDAAQKRDEVAKAMRPEQLDKARAKADLWKPRTPDLEANTPSIPEGWTVSTETTASVDMTKAVRNIQLILNKNGFDAGQPDGIMGEKTKQAIREFQTAHGLAATGEVDNALVSKLLDMK